MSDIEIEIQVKVEHVEPLLKFLQREARFGSEKRQRDEYFSPRDDDFLNVRPIAEWLRLREAGGKHTINYKNWHFEKDSKSHFCDEYETTVEDVGQMKNILQVLHFRAITVVDKVRKTWVWKNWEIAVDAVKNLGDFVEIEYKGDAGVDPKKETKAMILFLKKLGCGKIKINYLGYPFLLLFPQEAKYEDL